MAVTVPSGLETACLLAGSPTIFCLSSVKATKDGKAFPPKVRPSAAGIISGFPVGVKYAHALLDVPKSIPMIISFFLGFSLLSDSLVYFTLKSQFMIYLVKKNYKFLDLFLNDLYVIMKIVQD